MNHCPRLTRTCALVAMLTIAPGAFAQPANDSCAQAAVVSVNSVTSGNNTNANTDILMSPCTDDLDSFDVWYRLTASAAGQHTLDTVGSIIDTTLAVYSNCPPTNILVCNDDIDFDMGVFDSRVQLNLAAGQIVYIRIAGYGLDEGPFTLNIQGPSTGQGVCCRGVTCTTATLAACTGANTRFIQTSTVCNTASNYLAPCCHADFNKSGTITVQDVFDFLDAWFAANPIANFTGSGPPTVQSVFNFLDAWFAGGC